MEDKSYIKSVVRKSVEEFALEQLKSQNKSQQVKQETKEEVSLRKSALDDVLFYGLEDKKMIDNAKQRYLKESETDRNVVILKSDIDKLKSDFRSNVSPKATFIKQPNGEMIYAYNGQSGIDVKMSGFIPMGSEERVSFEFSLENEPFIEIKSYLNKDLVSIIEKLNDYYQSWSQEWFNKMNSEQV